MRVAIVSPHPVGTADSGDRVRSAQLLDELRSLGVDARLLAYRWTQGGEPAPWTEFVSGRPAGHGARWLLWRSQLAVAARRDPFAVHRARGPRDRMRQLIDEVEPDVVDFQHSFTWMPTGRANVVTLHNIDSQRYQTLEGVTARQYASVVRTECEAATAADATVVFSALDADRLIGRVTPRALHVVPIGTDPGQPLPVLREAVETIAYVGSYDYPPNVAAVESLVSLWPQIRLASGVRRLLIVGRRANEHFASTAELVVRSDVSSIRDALIDADALVVPLTSGGGVRVKIIEAFRLGLPVVSTPLGIEGLGAIDGVHAKIVGSADDIARGLVEIADRRIREQLVGAAQELWRREFSPRRMAERMLRVYESVLP